MQNYLSHLQSIGDNQDAFARKLQYLDYNYGNLIKKYKNPAILEIGPGNGALVKYLNDLKITNIDILDIDKHVLDYVGNKYKTKKSFLTNDISKIKNKLGKYDLIFLLQVFEHMPRNQYVRVIKTLFSALKKNGCIVIMVPNGGNPLNLLERYHDLQHENAFTEDSLYELPNYCGIEGAKLTNHPYKIPPVDLVNIIRIILQKILHLLIMAAIIINGGVYQTIMTPNITAIIEKKK